MPIITLPNGDQKSFDHAVSVMEVAESIGPGLAKNTVAGRVNDRLVDASDLISDDATLQIITHPQMAHRNAGGPAGQFYQVVHTAFQAIEQQG